MSGIVAETLRTIVEAAHCTERVQVFSYVADYASLWGVEDDGFPDPARLVHNADMPATIVIVWDGEPALKDTQGLGLYGYLSPLDWALAVSLSSASTTRQAFHILILDLYSHASSAFSVQLWPSIGGVMPWVRVYRPAISPAIPELLQDTLGSETLPPTLLETERSF